MNRRTLLAAAALVVCASAFATPLQTPQADQRSPEQTWLTFPEWFLVFSSSDYAQGLQKDQPASHFPFFRHVREFWRGYGQVIDATQGKYPFNSEYHTMIVVIGVSTTVEYGLKGGYEALVGRLSELTTTPNSTPEDRLATHVAQDYVDFIRIRPWYEFDFVTPLKTLWGDTPASGRNLLRKWERRYLLTSEWAVKATYAAAIKLATRSTFEIPKSTTLAVVSNFPSNSSNDSSIGVLERSGSHALLELPRYQAFTEAALALAHQGIGFKQIAGNEGTILMSVVVPECRSKSAGVSEFLRQRVDSRPGYERRVLEVPVNRLSEVLTAHHAAGDEIEHLFDY